MQVIGPILALVGEVVRLGYEALSAHQSGNAERLEQIAKDFDDAHAAYQTARAELRRRLEVNDADADAAAKAKP